RQMETLTMDREVMHLRDSLIPEYSTLVYNGFWFSPEREALQALVTETQRDVTGVVRLKLYKGNIIVAGRKSPKSLYDPKIATMEGERSTYDQGDATGFIRLPTGDGGALVFRTSHEAPVRCAVEVARALKNKQFGVRMGVHSGPIKEVTDLSEQGNIAGAGINMAQRVMDCGDAGHILLSK